MSTRRRLLIASGAALFAAPVVSRAQQPGKVYRIGLLRASELPADTADAFREGLKALGYIEGKNIVSSALQAASQARVQALVERVPPATAANRKQLIALVNGSRLPAIYSSRRWVEDGGLVSYGADLAHLQRRAATYVDKILKGAKPADLPVEQPSTFDLTVNLKTAKTLGLTIPQSILVRATRVIE